MAIVEGKWLCTSCGTKNLGRDTACLTCGKVRGKDVQFFVEDDAPEVTDAASLDKAKAGADWTCAWCGTDNRATQANCKQCAAQKGTSPSREQRDIPHGAGSNPPGHAPQTQPAKPAAKLNPIGMLILIGGVVLVGFLVYTLFLRTDDLEVNVRSASWERTVAVEAQRLMRETAWQEQVPAGARVLRTWEEKYGTERIQTGTRRVKTGRRDLGNGYFEDIYGDEPIFTERDVFKTKVEYEIYRWVVVRTVKSEGSSTQPAWWPDARLQYGEREGVKNESTKVVLVQTRADNPRVLEYSPPMDKLGQFVPGATFTAQVTITGIVTGVFKEQP